MSRESQLVFHTAAAKLQQMIQFIENYASGDDVEATHSATMIERTDKAPGYKFVDKSR